MPTPIAQRYYILMTHCDGGDMLQTPLRWVAPETRAKQIAALLNKRFADDAKHCRGMMNHLHFSVESGTTLGMEALLYDQSIAQFEGPIWRMLHDKVSYAQEVQPFVLMQAEQVRVEPDDFPPLDPCRYIVTIDDLVERMDKLEKPEPPPKQPQPKPAPAGNAPDDDFDFSDFEPPPAKSTVPPTAPSSPPAGKSMPAATPPTGPMPGPTGDGKQPTAATPPPRPTTSPSRGPRLPAPTTSDLCDTAGLSRKTFARIREEAGIATPPGGAGRKRTFTPAEVDRLISAARERQSMAANHCAEKWAKWSTNPPAADDPK